MVDDKTTKAPLGGDLETTVAAGQGAETQREIPTPQIGESKTVPSEPTWTPAVAPSEDKTIIISQRPKPVFAWLVILDGPPTVGIGKIFQLNPETTTIGRSPGNDVIIPDDTCSAQHAKIKIEKNEDDEEVFVLYDLASTNGTFVGTKETYREEDSRVYRHELKDGDYILIGETTLVFKKI